MTTPSSHCSSRWEPPILRYVTYLSVLQENYLKTNPSRVRDMDGPRKALKQLKLMEKASESISDGDLVDSLIHGYISSPCFSFPLSLCGCAALNNIGH